MSGELVWVVAFHSAALIVLRCGLHGRMWNFLGTYVLLAMVTFHVVPELLNLAYPGATLYRTLASDEEIKNWLFAFGPVPLIFVAAYLSVLGQRRLVLTSADLGGTRETVKLFKFWQCLAVTLPLYLVAVQGRGYVPGSRGDTNYAQAGVTAQFLLVGVVFTSFAAIQRFKRPAITLIIQSAALLLLGQRLTVIAGAAMLAFLLKRQGWKASRGEKAVIVAALVVGVLTVSSARATVGRAEFNAGSGPSERVSALVSGLESLGSDEGRAVLLDDFISRFDGNVFGAISMSRMDAGAPSVGLRTVRNIAVLAVPSALNPGKLQTAVTDRNEKGYIIDAQGFGTSVDFLPTPFGPGYAYFGLTSLYLLAVLLGTTMAWIDRRTRSNAPIASVGAVGTMNWILYYERGLEGAAIVLRGVLVLALLLGVVRLALLILHRGNQAAGARMSGGRPAGH